MKKGKFDPPPPPVNPLTDLHQNLHRWLRRGYLPTCKIYPNRITSFVSTHARLHADCLLAYFLVLSITHSQDGTTDIDAKYVKRRGSAEGCAFWGSQNQNLTSTPLFSQNRHFGTLFRRCLEISAENSFNIRGAKSKRPLNVIAAH